MQVEKPARYIGNEVNAVMKNPEEVEIRFAMCFPDVYEIGMSHLGIQILYDMLNSFEDVWCERVYSPWVDLDRIMREKHIPLFALESQDPITEFDFLGITIQYEMCYTNILQVLDLSGIPLLAKDRMDKDPIVIGGGPCTYNPEPITDFFDIFYIGEGETRYRELIDLYKECKKKGCSRQDFLRKAACIPGMYVPSLYEVTYHEDGTIAERKKLVPEIPDVIHKELVCDVSETYYPEKPVVPFIKVTQDRVVLEIQRGCIRGCRFCQAGHIYRPVRSRSVEKCMEYGKESLAFSGYHEITLLSLSTSDYRGLNELCDGLMDYCESRGIGLSLPSLRADNFSMDIMQRVQKVRKSGLTFAPEAGTQRLRDVINKNVTEEDLLRSCAVAFQGGWNSVKLYFMLGLPTETDEDVLGIAELADRVVHCWRENSPNRSHGLRVTVSTSCFVPKPHTPFQWEPQVTREEYMRRVTLLRDNMKARAVTYNWHDADTSLTEAVLSRGDRRLGAIIENIWRQGGFLESWSEGFDLKRWERAAEEEGISFPFYANRERSLDEVLPWDHLYMGVNRRHYIHEYEQAHQGLLSPDCRAQCSGCGAAAFLKGGRCDG